VEIEAQICKLESASSILPILSVAIGQQVSNPVNSCKEKIFKPRKAWGLKKWGLVLSFELRKQNNRAKTATS